MPDQRRPFILVPSAVPSDLPVALDRSEIDEVCAFNQAVRAAWNAVVAMAGKEKRHVTKQEIRRILFAAPKNLGDLVAVYRNAAAAGYDFEKDPDGLFSWDFIGRAVAEANPMQIDIKQPRNVDELVTVLHGIVRQFKRNIEENKLYEVLYRENGRPSEKCSHRDFSMPWRIRIARRIMRI